jgi:hypothetical protein
MTHPKEKEASKPMPTATVSEGVTAHTVQSQTNLLANAAKGTNQDTPGRAQAQPTMDSNTTGGHIIQN